MKSVMRMKKVLIGLLAVVLVLILAAAGFFFWKGGHHALYLWSTARELLESEASTHNVKVNIEGMELSAEAFWLDREGGRVYGLESGAFGVYLQDQVVYMGSGIAYTLPPAESDPVPLWKLIAGAAIYGQVSKEGDHYRFHMEVPEMGLSAEVTTDASLENISFSGCFPVSGTPIHLQAQVAHVDEPPTIPKQVSDAMVLAAFEPPMLLTEPMEAARTATRDLLPLTAELKLGVSCGILEHSETVAFTMDTKKAELEREGIIVTFALPPELSMVPTEILSLFVLHSGEYHELDGVTLFRFWIPEDMTAQLCTALVPQVEDMGITFQSSEALLAIVDGRLATVQITAEGSVPVFFTSIPLSFLAEFHTSS